MNRSILLFVIAIMACVLPHTWSFIMMTRSLPRARDHCLARRSLPRVVVVSMSGVDSILSKTPSDELSCARFKISGDLLGTAIFRAELKKELTFFYGCGAEFITPIDGRRDRAELICEGKTSKIVRFCKGWLNTMQSPLNTRKVSFQGPRILVHVDDAQWESYTGNVKGFTTIVPPPSILGETEIPDGKVFESTRMAGTDESV